AQGLSPLAHSHIRRGESYTPPTPKQDDHRLKSFSRRNEEGYSFTGVDHRVPPLTLSHTSTSQIKPIRQRPWLLYGLIGACVVIVLLAAGWTMQRYQHTEDEARGPQGDAIAGEL